MLSFIRLKNTHNSACVGGQREVLGGQEARAKGGSMHAFCPEDLNLQDPHSGLRSHFPCCSAFPFPGW